jgi:Recombination endonuclease VII
MPHKDPEQARTYFRERARRKRATKAGRIASNNAARIWYNKNRDKVLAKYCSRTAKDYRLRRAYGISLVQWEALLRKQKHRCALCNTKHPGTSKGWHTDHDHVTKRVRGILCKSCNTGLGQLGLNGYHVLSRLAQLRKYVRP